MPSLSPSLSVPLCAHWRPASVLALVAGSLLVSACGGGGESVSGALAVVPAVPVSASAGVSIDQSFPTGLAVASPAERPEVLSGETGVSLQGLLSLDTLFQPGQDAGCYGPAMLYANHEDGSGTESGLLPRGDLGLWQPTDVASGQPCVVAQLSQRTAPARLRTRQGVLLLAALRATIADSSGLWTMPAAGARRDLTMPFAPVLTALPALAGLNLHAATVSLDLLGTTYTYRLAFSQGTGAAARSGEIVLQHQPGATATDYRGVLRVAGFDLGTDAAEGCSDRMDSGRYQRAHVTTVRYHRAGDQIDVGTRSGQYCGAPASLADADHAAQVASFTTAGELDPVLPRWRTRFDRFGGSYDRTTGAGQFLSVWQASPSDSHARALAATTTYDRATDTRTVQGYAAFSADVATTDGSLLGMVCNWGGPGAVHTPAALFQSQTATLTGADTTFVATASRLAYAPTNACSSTTTLFDANADGTLAAGEGMGVLQTLDAPASPSLSVQGELLRRGYRLPSDF
jgi:hypothetical protein